jgi:hypothetical protein
MMTARLLATLDSVVLGLAFSAAAIVSGPVAQQPWGTACHLAWCQPRPAMLVNPAGALADAAAAARLTVGAVCSPASTFKALHPAVLPRTMVVKDRAGVLSRVRWTYPAPAATTVITLCV